MKPIVVAAVAAVAAITGLATVPAWSQSGPYPAKIIRIINPLAAGGNVDIVVRGVAEQMSKQLGQQVLVENRPSASALLGTRYVKGQPADGYTLLAIANTFARVPAILTDAGYDPVKDFTGVSQTCDIPMVMVINPSLPVKNFREFIALAKKRPGELTYGSAGVGGTGHVAAEMLSQQAGIKLMHIPYKGNAPATTDLVGGQIMLMFDQVSTSAAYIKAGRLRALAVTSTKRTPLFPDLPTIDESGVKGFHDTTFNGLMAPAGTPRDILEKLRTDVVRAVAVQSLRDRFDNLGIPLVASASLDEYNAFIRSNVEDFAKLAKTAGIKAN
jgi:tripartite-type tricarboxylate transporter receptor subunit TctC